MPLSRQHSTSTVQKDPGTNMTIFIALKKKKNNNKRWYYHLNSGVHHFTLMQDIMRCPMAVSVSFKTWIITTAANSAGLNLWSFQLIKPCSLHWLEANILCGFVWVFSKRKINKYPGWIHYSRFFTPSLSYAWPQCLHLLYEFRKLQAAWCEGG